MPSTSFVPEFNVTGWMAKEIKATIPDSERVIAGPRVCGGMTMPPEIIVEEIKTVLGMRAMLVRRTRKLIAACSTEPNTTTE